MAEESQRRHLATCFQKVDPSRQKRNALLCRKFKFQHRENEQHDSADVEKGRRANNCEYLCRGSRTLSAAAVQGHLCVANRISVLKQKTCILQQEQTSHYYA